MAGVGIAQVIEGRSVAQLLKQDSVRTHTQAAFEKLLRTELREALAVLRIEQPNMVRLRYVQLKRILNGKDALMSWNALNQAL